MTPTAARFIPTGFVPTAEQTAIQTSTARAILVEANAGAAKTTTLALRIGEALARGMAPGAILGLVFTPEAREVMAQRLLEIGIAASIAAQVRIETFESLAAAVLGEFEPAPPPSLSSARALRPTVVEAINAVGEKFGQRFDGLDISTHNLAVTQFLDVQMSVKARMLLQRNLIDEDLPAEEAAELAGLSLTHLLSLREYEERRLGPFDEARFRGPFDATYDLARTLDTVPEIRALLPSAALVLCDELHDMNEASFRILLALLGKGRSAFVGAGDKDQVIHATLGADPSYLRERFDAELRTVERLPLSITYRHGPHLALAIGTLKKKASDSALTERTDIALLEYPAGDWEQGAARVVAALRKWERETDAVEDCAILIRDRHQSIAIENALMHAGIAYRCLGLNGYLQREEILFLRGMLAIALGNLELVKSKETIKAIVDALVLFGEVDFGGVYFTDAGGPLAYDKALEKTKTLISDDPTLLGSFFAGQLKRGGSEIRNRIVGTVEFVAGLPPEASAGEALREIWARMRLDAAIRRVYVDPREADVVIRSAEGFIELATRLAMNLGAFSEWLGGIASATARRRARKVVLLERVETAKGKEFGHVILPFLESGEFPRAGRGHGEEENLFYVGATRAKARLSLVVPAEAPRRSVFIERLGLGPALSAKAEASIARNAARHAAPTRTDLNVPYAAKDQAKELGARWDPVRKTWYVEAGVSLEPFKPWLKA